MVLFIAFKCVISGGYHGDLSAAPYVYYVNVMYLIRKFLTAVLFILPLKLVAGILHISVVLNGITPTEAAVEDQKMQGGD